MRTVAAQEAWPFLDGAGIGLLALGGAVFALDVILYAAKMVYARDAFRADDGDATDANLLASAFMAAMVLCAESYDAAPVCRWLWIAAAAGHAALLARFVGRWMTQAFDPLDLNPTWFLPAAGLMTVAMTDREFWPASLTWICYAAGFGLWLALMPQVMRRLVFEPPLPARLRPTTILLAAPPGLAAHGLFTLAPEAPAYVAGAFAYFGAFLLAALFARPRFLAHAGPTLTWWATTFPTATIASALSALAARTGALVDRLLALGVLVLAVAFAFAAAGATMRLTWRTLLGRKVDADAELAAMRGEASGPP